MPTPTNFAKMESAFADRGNDQYGYATVPVGFKAGSVILVGEDDTEGGLEARQFSAVPSNDPEVTPQADVNGLDSIQFLIRPGVGEDALPSHLSIFTWVRTSIVETVDDEEVTTYLWAPLETEETILFEGVTWLDGQCYVSPLVSLGGCWDRLAVEIGYSTLPVRIYVTPGVAVPAEA